MSAIATIGIVLVVWLALGILIIVVLISHAKGRLMETVQIPFTQYLQPNGKQVPIFLDVDPETGAKAKAIIARGLRFEAEILMTGHVSFTIADPLEGEDLDIRVVPNGPGTMAAVVDLIRGFEIPTDTVQ